jgi:hypothetical protein
MHNDPRPAPSAAAPAQPQIGNFACVGIGPGEVFGAQLPALTAGLAADGLLPAKSKRAGGFGFVG